MTNNSVHLSRAICEQLSGNFQFDCISEISDENTVTLTAEANVSSSSSDVIVMQWALQVVSLWSKPCG